MICPSCGSQNKDGNQFCNSCGNRIVGVADNTAPAVSLAPDASPVAPVPPVAPAPGFQMPVNGYAAPQMNAGPVYPAPGQGMPYQQMQAGGATALGVKTRRKKKFNIFSIIATVMFIVSFFLPAIQSRQFGRISGSSAFGIVMEALQDLDEEGAVIWLILVGATILITLALGIPGSFNIRPCAIIAAFIPLIYSAFILLVICEGVGCDFVEAFEYVGIGLYLTIGSSPLYFIGGCSGV